jgi:hypothetical protein
MPIIRSLSTAAAASDFKLAAAAATVDRLLKMGIRMPETC